jgi:hypothetical protein
MKTKILLTSLVMIFSTSFALAMPATISPSQDPIFICDNTPYFELNAVGDTGAHVFTWTVGDDIHAYGRTFYFVPQAGDSNAIVRLYKGVIPNDTVDKDPSKLLGEVTININDCGV